VGKRAGKALADETKKCGTLPDFAAGSSGLEAAHANVVSIDKALWLLVELFGDDLDLATVAKATSKERASCQQKVLKSVQKCVNTKVKEFNKCKKLGLTGKTPPGLIDSAQGLEDRCFQAIIDDQKGKVAKACAGVAGKGIDGAVAKACTAKGITGSTLEGVFPGVTPPVTSAELDRIAECDVCTYLNELDGLARDCDLFDDAMANGSCSLCLNLDELASEGIPAEVCVPPSSQGVAGADVDVCPVSNCAGGASGCPVSITPSSIATDVLAGTTEVQGAIDASGFEFDVSFLGSASCTATTATADFDLNIEVAFVSAGPSSVIVDSVVSTNLTLSNESITIGGGALCSLADFATDLILPLVEADILSQVESLVASTIVGQEVCVDSAYTACSDLLMPLAECGSSMSCTPTGSGFAICGPAGAETQGAPCTVSTDCAPGYVCVVPGTNECAQWCTITGDCPGATVCTSLSPSQFVDGQEWGVCQ
jgi:hypothetical protein